jgi:UDP-2,3-diacylglucosamine pyrophosphatase LpxH
MIYKGKDKRLYYIFHGDVLDVFSSKFKLVAKIGSIGYDFALWLNRWYNKYREWRGLPYYSISKDIKNGVKSAITFISDFESRAVQMAKKKNCDVAICGHIHQTALRDDYMNSGDWCENCTALVEDSEGKWTIINYHL